MYQVQVTHEKDLAFTVKAQTSEFVIDAKGNGLTPLDALLSGLGSCIGVYICKYAQGVKMEFGNFEVKVSAQLSTEAPFTFKTIKVEIDLKALVLEERRQKALLEFIKHCPAHNTLKGDPQIDFILIC